MADVFISYGKADRPLAFKLAAMLEAEGWKVWWDTTLIPGDDFRKEIMTELGRARAVVVIWTDASIKSDWVRSEAGRAQADRKLIPVKVEHLTYKDLPPPFDVLHTENVGEDDKIRAAVVAQLAKPAVEPSAAALLTKGFKYEVLTWVGIVGGAVTLFGNLDAALKLADWARVLVEHWKEWTHAFWVWAFGWLGIYVPPEWTPVLSFLLFWLLLTIGQGFQFSRLVRNRPTIDKYQGKSFQLTSWREWRSFLLLLFTLTAVGGLSLTQDVFSNVLKAEKFSSVIIPYMAPLLTILMIIALLLQVTDAVPRVLSIRPTTSRDASDGKLHTVVATCLLVIFWTIITFNQFIAMPSKGFAERAAVAMILALPLILLSVAPAKAVSRRLIFLALGLLLLIALNELSKLGLDLTAPKLQG